MTKIEHEDIRVGDVIELADEPALVRDVVPWVGGCCRVAIERPAVGTSAPGARGSYYLGSPVRLLERSTVLV